MLKCLTHQTTLKASGVPHNEDSGNHSMVPAYLGKPGSEGYDARRADVVALLAKYGVPSAKALQPEQLAPFKAELEAL